MKLSVYLAEFAKNLMLNESLVLITQRSASHWINNESWKSDEKNEELISKIQEGAQERLPEISKQVPKQAIEGILSIARSISRKDMEEYFLKNRLLTLFNEMELYLEKCFRFLYRQNPMILGKKQIPLERLLELGDNYSLKFILEEKIEKELHELFYKEMKAIFKLLRDKGLQHNLDNKSLEELQQFKLIRNLYVHGAGIINHIFLQKSNNKGLKIGEKLELSKKLLADVRRLVNHCLKEVDKCLIGTYPKLLCKDPESYVELFFASGPLE